MSAKPLGERDDMFRKLTDERGVSSTEGFTVVRTGSPLTQFVVTYAEFDGHSVDYPLENLVADATDVIRAGEIRYWKPPFEAEVIPHGKRVEIAKRMAAGMNALGEEFEFSEQ